MLKALECTKGIFFISYIIQLPERNGKQLLRLSMLCTGSVVGFFCPSAFYQQISTETRSSICQQVWLLNP